MNPLTSVFLGVICGCASILTTVGNGLVIFVIWWTPALQTPSNLFIVSLAVADFIIGIFVMPIASVSALVGHWPFANWLCTAWICFDYVASSSSILNLMTMAIDRYFSIVSPITYRNKRTHKKLLTVIGIVWCCSVVYMLPIICWEFWFPAIPDTADQKQSSVNATLDDGEEDFCNPGFHDHFQFKIISLLYSFVFPFITMCLVYIRIFVEIHRRTKRDIQRKNKLLLQSPGNDQEHGGSKENIIIPVINGPPINLSLPNISECRLAEHKNDLQPLNPTCNPSGTPGDFEHESPKLLHPDTGRGGLGTPVGSRRANSPDMYLMAPKSPISRQLSWRKKEAKQHHQKSLERQREFRAAKKLAGIVFAFCICWLPYMVLYVVVACKPFEFSAGWRKNMFTASIWLGYFNSTLNPVLYPFCIEDFKKALKPIIGTRLARFI